MYTFDELKRSFREIFFHFREVFEKMYGICRKLPYPFQGDIEFCSKNRYILEEYILINFVAHFLESEVSHVCKGSCDPITALKMLTGPQPLFGLNVHSRITKSAIVLTDRSPNCWQNYDALALT